MAKFILFPVINLPATGHSIERCRKAAGLSVRDVQSFFGFEYPQAVYKWQRGECLPSVDNLLALARLLKVSMEDLLVYEDQEVPLVFGAQFLMPCSCFLRGFFILSPKKNKKASVRLPCSSGLSAEA